MRTSSCVLIVSLLLSYCYAAIAIICDLTDCGYHEVEVSLILVLGILERVMLGNTGLQQDNALLIFARFLAKVRIESFHNSVARSIIITKYADKMLSVSGQCLRDRLSIGVGSSKSSTVHQIAITNCWDRPCFTTYLLICLRQPHIHNLVITHVANQYLAGSLIASKSKGTLPKTFKTHFFVIPGHTMAIDEQFDPKNPEDVSTVIRELFKSTSAEFTTSDLVVWNIPDLLAYIANHMTAVQQDIPSYPADSTNSSQQTVAAEKKGLWVLRCLILRDIHVFHVNMAVRAMANVPSLGDFNESACEFVCQNIPHGTFAGTTPLAVAVVFDPRFDFTPITSTSGYQTLRSIALPVVVWYMLTTFGIPMNRYANHKEEAEVVQALIVNNNLHKQVQLPELLRRLIWGKDFNIFQLATGPAATTTMWDICTNPAEDAGQNTGAPLQHTSLPRPSSQPVDHLSKKPRNDSAPTEVSNNTHEGEGDDADDASSSHGGYQEDENEDNDGYKEVEDEDNDLNKRKKRAMANANHGVGGDDADDASSHHDNDDQQEEEEYVLISKTNPASNAKRRKKAVCSQPEEEPTMDGRGIYNDIGIDIIPPRLPPINNEAVLRALAMNFVNVDVAVLRSSKLPVCGSFKLFEKNVQIIHGVTSGFVPDQFKIFASSGIYKLGFKPQNGSNSSSHMALIRNDQWICCMTGLKLTGNVIHFESLAYHLPDNKTVLLCHAFQMFCYMLAATFREVSQSAYCMESVDLNVSCATKQQLNILKTIHGSQLDGGNSHFVCGTATWE
jgi:hypothetical protein